MKKRFRKLACIFAILCLALAVTACGSSLPLDKGGLIYSGNSSEDMGYIDEPGFVENGDFDEEYIGDTSENTIGDIVNSGNVKLIYRANMTIQTTDFDKTYQEIYTLVDKLGGYFESSEVYNGSYYDNKVYKNGCYVIRIPSENYREFMNSVGDKCYVTNVEDGVENVGEAYFNIESHIKTLKVKIQRLQDLLKEAATVTDIIEIESALSEAEYELEQYESSLRHYDSLIDYSTVTINLDTVSQLEPGVSNPSGFGTRILQDLKNGLVNFLEGIEDFISWAAYNIVGIIFVVVIVVLLIKFKVFKKIFGREGKKNAFPEKKEEE